MTSQFSKIFPVPDNPIDNGNPRGWDAVEKLIGVVLPSDYKDFINIYGTGVVGGFVWHYNPFSSNPFLNLIQQLEEELVPLRELKQEFGNNTCPYPIFPEEGGLFPWGRTDNGDVLFWKTSGSPVSWIVIIHEARSNNYEEFQLSMTSFYQAIVQGKINSKVIQTELINLDQPFIAIS
jgi:hypothetical protein